MAEDRTMDVKKRQDVMIGVLARSGEGRGRDMPPSLPRTLWGFVLGGVAAIRTGVAAWPRPAFPIGGRPVVLAPVLVTAGQRRGPSDGWGEPRVNAGRMAPRCSADSWPPAW